MRIEPVTTEAQIDDVLAIEEAAFTNPWTREMYLAELENHGVSFCFLAKDDDGRAVGFCSVWRVVDELHINNLAVLPELRRGGIGSALLEHVLRARRRLGGASARRSRCASRTMPHGFFTSGSASPWPASGGATTSKPVEDALVLWRENLGNFVTLKSG